MAYAQDTITNANAANVLVLVLDGLLIGEGWTLVEEITPSGTYRTRVYLSDGTLNACGYDWYIALMWNTVGTEQNVEIVAGGAYDAGTNSLSQIPGIRNGTGSTSGSNRQYTEPVTGAHMGPLNVGTAVATGTTFSTHGVSVTKPWFATVVPSSAFAYWASVTLDHVSLYTTIAPGANRTAFYFAASLDVAPEWTGLPFDVAENPLISYGYSAGPSASIVGTGTTNVNFVNPTVRFANQVGVILPALESNYLPAYAWRDEHYVTSVDGATSTGFPWNSLQLGEGLHIGTGIDYYMVYGGNIGDTVEIDAATYVLSGQIPLTASIPANAYIAVLVE